jgi:hypothetical protein
MRFQGVESPVSFLPVGSSQNLGSRAMTEIIAINIPDFRNWFPCHAPDLQQDPGVPLPFESHGLLFREIHSVSWRTSGRTFL